MAEMVAEAHEVCKFGGMLFAGAHRNIRKCDGEFHILLKSEIGLKVELLKDDADFLLAKGGEFVAGHFCDVLAVNDYLAG